MTEDIEMLIDYILEEQEEDEKAPILKHLNERELEI